MQEAVMKPQPLPWAAELVSTAVARCRSRGWLVADPWVDESGYFVLDISIPSYEENITLTLNGEVFQLIFPGNFVLTEFGASEDDGREVLAEVLDSVDAYVHPSTKYVETARFLRSPEIELRLSNGATLRHHGWSKGPVRDTSSSN
jgi:hypothetical protein